MTQQTSHLRLTPWTALFALIALVLLAGCSGSDDDPRGGPGGGSHKEFVVDLDIEIQGWTGWSREQPDPTYQAETVRVGDAFEVDVIGDPMTITVVGISGDEIKFRTSQAMAERTDGGGIDVRSDETEFTMPRGGELSLTTPTMDGGTTVTLAES